MVNGESRKIWVMVAFDDPDDRPTPRYGYGWGWEITPDTPVRVSTDICWRDYLIRVYLREHGLAELPAGMSESAFETPEQLAGYVALEPETNEPVDLDTLVGQMRDGYSVKLRLARREAK